MVSQFASFQRIVGYIDGPENDGIFLCISCGGESAAKEPPLFSIRESVPPQPPSLQGDEECADCRQLLVDVAQVRVD